MYGFGNTFLKKEDYGELENDLTKIGQPYAKVLRLTKAMMMMEDGRVYSLPERIYQGSPLRGQGDSIYSDPDSRSGSYEMTGKEWIERIRENNGKIISVKVNDTYSISMAALEARMKKLVEKNKEEAKRHNRERRFAILIQERIRRDTMVFRDVYRLLDYYRTFSLLTLCGKTSILF